MGTATTPSLSTYLRQLFQGPRADGPGDGALLRQFVEGRDETAFALLVRRHGPLVYGVCRRLLDDAQDVEDAFQAAFLVLVRKGASLRRPDHLGPWLYGVAYRTALKARSRSRRRLRHEKPMATRADPAAAPVPAPDLREVLDVELGGLPERYRAPLVLCYLEGHTKEEAARRLGWPAGTVSGRLARAKELLRGRLTRRGVTLAAHALGAALTAEALAREPPAALLQATAGAAAAFRASPAAALMTALPLAKGVLRQMFWIQLRGVALTGAAAIVLVCMGLGLTTAPQVRAGDPPAAPAKAPTDVPADKPADKAAATPAAKPAAPIPTAEIRRVLAEPTDKLKTGIDKGTPLRDALDYVCRTHPVSGDRPLKYRFLHQAFQDVGAPDIEERQVELPPFPQVPLSTVLNDLLSRISGCPCSYLIRGDHLVIMPTAYLTGNDEVPARVVREPVLVTAESKPLAEVLKDLAEATGVNIVLDARAKEEALTPVTVRLQQVALDTAVILLAEMAQLKVVIVENVLYVAKPQDAANLEKGLKARKIPPSVPGAGT